MKALAISHHRPPLSHRSSRPILIFGKLDLAIASVLFLAISILAVTYLQTVGLGNFYQRYFGPAVAWACRGDFAGIVGSLNMGEAQTRNLEPLARFLAQQASSFDCKNLPERLDYAPLDAFQRSLHYTLLSAGVVWRVFGVTWSNLNVLGALLAGLSAAFLFGFCRLFVSRFWAVSVVIATALSAYQLDMLPQLRDYSKQPFLFACLFFAGWLITAPRGGLFHLATALAAFVAAIGLGFRTDLLLAVPFLIVVLAVRLVVDHFRGALQVGLGALIFATVFSICAFPVLGYYLESGGGSGHVILLGLMVPFNKALGLTTPVFDIGHLYNDPFATGLVNEFAYQFSTNPSLRSELGVNEARYDLFANQLLKEYLIQFPADLVARVLAAIIRAGHLEFPGSQGSNIPLWTDLSQARSILVVPGIGLWLTGLAASILAARKLRLCLFYIVSFAFFAGSGALQFSYRHVFYLEAFYWLSAAIGFSSLLKATTHIAKATLHVCRLDRRPRADAFGDIVPWPAVRRMLTGAVMIALLSASAAGLLAASRAYQQASSTQLFGRYLSTPREVVQIEEVVSGDSVILKPVGTVRDMAGEAVSIEEITSPRAFYFVLTADGARCNSRELRVKVQYAADQAYYDFSRTVHLVLLKRANPSYIFIPVRSSEVSWSADSSRRAVVSRFQGFSVPAADRACVRAVEAVTDFRSLRMPLWLRLAPGWEERDLYQTFARPILPPSVANFGPVTVANPDEIAEQLGSHKLEISSLSDGAWETVVAPARLRGASVVMAGTPLGPGAYVAVSRKYRLQKGSLIAAAGSLERGGLVLGLLNHREQWATTVTTPLGEFQAVVRVPADGEYRIVLANNLAPGEAVNAFTVNDVGFVSHGLAELQSEQRSVRTPTQVEGEAQD